jgi:hypothetical protein
MVTRVRETLAETKARLTLELAQRTQIRLASLKLKVEAKARADKRLSAKGRKTTAHNLFSTTTTTTTTSTTTHTTTTTTITTTTTNEPTFQKTSPK